MNILIFGGAGFIGSNLIERLIDNHKIICVDNLLTGRLKNIDKFINNENFLFINKDITDNLARTNIEFEIENFFNRQLDEIYNLACPASPKKYQINPLHTIYTCFSVDWMCSLAKKYNAKFLHSSTSEVYGDPDIEHIPQSEIYKGNVNCIGPRSCYDEGKRIAETIIYEWTKLGVNSKVIRIFNTYGPNMDPEDGRVISNFICQALSNKDITIYGDGSITRSFQYIDDLLDAIDLVMHVTNDNFHGPVNIGNTGEFTIKELAELVLELLPDSKSKIVYLDSVIDDPKQRRPNTSLAFNILNGWVPKVNLKEGVINTITYFRKEI